MRVGDETGKGAPGMDKFSSEVDKMHTLPKSYQNTTSFSQMLASVCK
jgi:hypothetical protein